MNNFNLLTSHITGPNSTGTGYNIYKLKPNIEKKISCEFGAAISNMILLDSTNLSIILSALPTTTTTTNSKPFRPENTLVLWDDKKKSSILELTVNEKIVNAH